MKKGEKDAVSALRRRQALALRAAGASYDQIADKLEFSDRSGAYRCVEAVMTELREQTLEDAARVRRLEAVRLDEMTLALWPNVRKGDTSAINAALRVMDRRAKLFGLDQVETGAEDPVYTGPLETPAEARELLASLLPFPQGRKYG